MGAILRVEALEKVYGARPVLRGVDLHLEPGTASLLVGDNGSGKTSLLRILATLARPTRGRVLLGTDDPEDARGAAARARLGFVADRPLVYDDLTGRENLRWVAQVAGASRRDADEAASHWLERMGLARRADERAGNYSLGMKQRLTIARALVTSPEVLLLDEPSASLDAASRDVLRRTLEELKGTATVLLATHDPDGFGRWPDRVLRLEGGRIVEAAA